MFSPGLGVDLHLGMHRAVDDAGGDRHPHIQGVVREGAGGGDFDGAAAGQDFDGPLQSVGDNLIAGPRVLPDWAYPYHASCRASSRAQIFVSDTAPYASALSRREHVQYWPLAGAEIAGKLPLDCLGMVLWRL